MPHPKSGVHLAVSRTRLGQLNDSDYNSKLFQAADEIISEQNPQKILVLSEQTFLPLILASKLKNTAAQVICYELNHHFKDFVEGNKKYNLGFIKYTHLNEKVFVISSFKNPFFQLFPKPMDSINFWKYETKF